MLLDDADTAKSMADAVAPFFPQFADNWKVYRNAANAAAGILRRAVSVGRTLFAPMREALENMVTSASAAAPPRDASGEQGAKASIRPPRADKRGHSQHDGAAAGGAVRAGY